MEWLKRLRKLIEARRANSVTNLGLKSLECPEIGRFHFLYWEVTGATCDARLMRVIFLDP